MVKWNVEMKGMCHFTCSPLNWVSKEIVPEYNQITLLIIQVMTYCFCFLYSLSVQMYATQIILISFTTGRSKTRSENSTNLPPIKCFHVKLIQIHFVCLIRVSNHNGSSDLARYTSTVILLEWYLLMTITFINTKSTPSKPLTFVAFLNHLTWIQLLFFHLAQVDQYPSCRPPVL